MRNEEVSKKVRYVKKQKQTRNHKCHWPGCNQQVPPALWGCLFHWRKLPATLHKKIWDAYRVGQEKFLEGKGPIPTREYLEVAREVQEWIKENYSIED
jgi:hypothetical protein